MTGKEIPENYNTYILPYSRTQRSIWTTGWLFGSLDFAASALLFNLNHSHILVSGPFRRTCKRQRPQRSLGFVNGQLSAFKGILELLMFSRGRVSAGTTISRRFLITRETGIEKLQTKKRKAAVITIEQY
jgi:hypothetical protein